MSQPIATGLVWALSLYAIAGFIFAIPFVIRGVGRIDPVARSGTIGFRILIIPGTIALWPLLLRRWAGGRRQPPSQRTAHQRPTPRRSIETAP
ncbi:MAG TPA: hypothetical protein VK845_11795 [Gemmatimonadales bacterium]|nr:hypothetical protein [Gemmatimonadales bacterium]